MKMNYLFILLKRLYNVKISYLTLPIFLSFFAALSVTKAHANDAHVQRTVSFLANVDAGQFETVFTVVRGIQKITTEQLNDLIRPDGGHVLRIRSIHAHLLPGVPEVGDYAAFFLGACTEEFSTRGFGAGSVAVGDTANEQVTFLPGVVARLTASDRLCLKSLIQSTHTVRVEVHGVLERLKE